MKQLLLILFSPLLAFNGPAQVNSGNEAFSKYHSGDYQSAVKLYRAKIGQKATLYDQFMLSLCYIKTDSATQAKQEFEKIIASKGDHFSDHFRVEGCEALAKLCLQEKDYSQALYFYRLLAAIFEKAKFNDVNWIRFHFFNANDQARCYAALGMTDSAITALTPYMFCTYKALNPLMMDGLPDHYYTIDSLKHDSITRFYEALLQSRYTNKQIKAEFQKAEQSFTFAEDRSPADQHGFICENIKCSVDVYGVHVVVLQRNIGDHLEKLLKEVQKPLYTRAYQLEYFRQLLVCRIARDLPG